jgi:hypothetical protein
MYYGQSKEFIHYLELGWSSIVLARVKAFESQWHYNKNVVASGFGMSISFSLFIIQYVNVGGEFPTMM